MIIEFENPGGELETLETDSASREDLVEACAHLRRERDVLVQADCACLDVLSAAGVTTVSAAGGGAVSRLVVFDRERFARWLTTEARQLS